VSKTKVGGRVELKEPFVGPFLCAGSNKVTLVGELGGGGARIWAVGHTNSPERSAGQSRRFEQLVGFSMMDRPDGE